MADRTETKLAAQAVAAEAAAAAQADAAIRSALEAGASLSELSEATGLSPTALRNRRDRVRPRRPGRKTAASAKRRMGAKQGAKQGAPPARPDWRKVQRDLQEQARIEREAEQWRRENPEDAREADAQPQSAEEQRARETEAAPAAASDSAPAREPDPAPAAFSPAPTRVVTVAKLRSVAREGGERGAWAQAWADALATGPAQLDAETLAALRDGRDAPQS